MIAILKDKKIVGNTKQQVVKKLKQEVQNKLVYIYWNKEQIDPLKTTVHSAIFFSKYCGGK